MFIDLHFRFVFSSLPLPLSSSSWFATEFFFFFEKEFAAGFCLLLVLGFLFVLLIVDSLDFSRRLWYGPKTHLKS